MGPHRLLLLRPSRPTHYLAGTRMEEVAARPRRHHRLQARGSDRRGSFARTGGVPVKERHPAPPSNYRLQEPAPEQSAKTRPAARPPPIDPPYRAVNPAPSSYAFIAGAEGRAVAISARGWSMR